MARPLIFRRNPSRSRQTRQRKHRHPNRRAQTYHSQPCASRSPVGRPHPVMHHHVCGRIKCIVTCPTVGPRIGADARHRGFGGQGPAPSPIRGAASPGGCLGSGRPNRAKAFESHAEYWASGCGVIGFTPGTCQVSHGMWRIVAAWFQIATRSLDSQPQGAACCGCLLTGHRVLWSEGKMDFH